MDEDDPLSSSPQQSDRTQRFTCEQRSGGRGAAWVSLRGQLDLAGAPYLRRVLQEALDDALLVIADLRQLTFIDSTGIHLFFEADDYARQKGRRFVIVRTAELIGRLPLLTEIDPVIRVLDVS